MWSSRRRGSKVWEFCLAFTAYFVRCSCPTLVLTVIYDMLYKLCRRPGCHRVALTVSYARFHGIARSIASAEIFEWYKPLVRQERTCSIELSIIPHPGMVRFWSGSLVRRLYWSVSETQCPVCRRLSAANPHVSFYMECETWCETCRTVVDTPSAAHQGPSIILSGVIAIVVGKRLSPSYVSFCTTTSTPLLVCSPWLCLRGSPARSHTVLYAARRISISNARVPSLQRVSVLNVSLR